MSIVESKEKTLVKLTIWSRSSIVIKVEERVLEGEVLEEEENFKDSEEESFNSPKLNKSSSSGKMSLFVEKSSKIGKSGSKSKLILSESKEGNFEELKTFSENWDKKSEESKEFFNKSKFASFIRSWENKKVFPLISLNWGKILEKEDKLGKEKASTICEEKLLTKLLLEVM